MPVFLPDDNQIESSAAPISTTFEPMSPPSQEILAFSKPTRDEIEEEILDSDSDSDTVLDNDSYVSMDSDSSDGEYPTANDSAVFDRLQRIDDITTRVITLDDIFEIISVTTQRAKDELLTRCLTITKMETFRRNCGKFLHDWMVLKNYPRKKRGILVRLFKKEIFSKLEFRSKQLTTKKKPFSQKITSGDDNDTPTSLKKTL